KDFVSCKFCGALLIAGTCPGVVYYHGHVRNIALVEVDGIDDGIEAVVVVTQRVEHLQHHSQLLAVIQGLGRGHPRTDRDWQHDVAVVFARRFAHHTTHRLDDVDHGVARVEKDHRV